jgi:hypothetical protein
MNSYTTSKKVNNPFSVRILERLLVNLTEFQEDIWYHLRDTRKSKMISIKESKRFFQATKSSTGGWKKTSTTTCQTKEKRKEAEK